MQPKAPLQFQGGPSWRGVSCLLALALALGLSASGLSAAEYDPAIPSPESVLGYRLGVWVTDYAGMERYLSSLAQVSPRVGYGTYGTDYERRQLRRGRAHDGRGQLHPRPRWSPNGKYLAHENFERTKRTPTLHDHS